MGVKLALLPKESLPREKARREGISSLSDEEVLALILSSGVAGESALDLSRSLLAHYGGFSSLGAASSETLMENRGIKEAKALLLSAVFEVARRAAKEAPQSQDSPAEELYEHYHLSLEDEIGEKGLVLLYDRRGHFLKEKILFSGSEDQLSASPKLVLSEKALGRLRPLFHCYLCLPEKEACRAEKDEQSLLGADKVKIARAKYKGQGSYIEDILR